MKRLCIRLSVTAGVLLGSAFSLVSPASAGNTIVITDPSAVKYGIQGNMVYLRNLSDFDSSWLPCCYNYWFDLSTDGGRAMFSTFLSYRLSGQSLTFYKSSWATSGPIDIVGAL